MKTEVLKKLEEAGISTTGIYASLPQAIEDAVDNVKAFGYTRWVLTTSFGNSIRKIVSELANK